MNKKDKKFFIALAFAQTAVLSFLVVLSPYYWIKEAEQWDNIRAQVEFGRFLRDQTNYMESELKVQKLKQGFEQKGIGVEETVDLSSK